MIISIIIPIILLTIEFIFLGYLLFSVSTKGFKIKKLYIWKKWLFYDEDWPLEILSGKNSGLRKVKNLKVINKQFHYKNERIDFFSNKYEESFKKTYLDKSIKINGILYLVKLDEEENLSFEPF